MSQYNESVGIPRLHNCDYNKTSASPHVLPAKSSKIKNHRRPQSSSRTFSYRQYSNRVNYAVVIPTPLTYPTLQKRPWHRLIVIHDDAHTHHTHISRTIAPHLLIKTIRYFIRDSRRLASTSIYSHTQHNRAFVKSQARVRERERERAAKGVQHHTRASRGERESERALKLNLAGPPPLDARDELDDYVDGDDDGDDDGDYVLWPQSQEHSPFARVRFTSSSFCCPIFASSRRSLSAGLTSDRGVHIQLFVCACYIKYIL